jgi:cyclopropane fatty-acyl-phospholipid synthase-like methyltransferase
MPTDRDYQWYEASVMDAPDDMRQFRRIFSDYFSFAPRLYREDFCGTFSHAVEWVKYHPENRAWALDLSSEPLAYGLKTHASSLTDEQRKRLKICQQNVMKPIPSKVDIVTAMNFSYSFFKEREVLKDYFRQAYKALKAKGLFLIDVTGGSQSGEPNEEKRRVSMGKGEKSLTYFWEQKSFDPITSEASFAIHFQVAGSARKLRNRFTYEWRLWTIRELREIMAEVGFQRTDVYWEGFNRQGGGNGVFKRRERVENCAVWIAYLAAAKY